MKNTAASRIGTYSSNLCVMVGNFAGGMRGCLGHEVDGVDEFQGLLRVSWKKDVFVRFWEL